MPAEKRKHKRQRPRHPKKRQTSKTKQIVEAVESLDVAALRQFSLSEGGFGTAELRARCWPLLCRARSTDHIRDEDKELEDGERPRDADQVHLDVNRSLTHLLPTVVTEKQLLFYRDQLEDVLLRLFKRYPYLNYYQGFHDIASLLLLSLPSEGVPPMLESLTLFYLRDHLLPTLNGTEAQLNLIMPILARTTPKVHSLLKMSNGIDGPEYRPYFAISWILTWFTHDINDIRILTRLWDLFIAHGPVMVVYVCTSLIAAREKEIVGLAESDPDVDSAMLHHMLSKISLSTNWETIITNAWETYKSHPPSVLQVGKLLKSGVIHRFYDDIWRLPPGKSIPVSGHPEKLFQKEIRELERLGSSQRYWLGRVGKVLAASALVAAAGVAWYAYENVLILEMSF
ncbi:rab-GTPase-TBC domain-containing protein [Gaertneriomyces semiglobifer]|nr:rab-GTPase-TBC domain-containing protein [Gaertneriomyces semiglobifer]